MSRAGNRPSLTVRLPAWPPAPPLPESNKFKRTKTSSPPARWDILTEAQFRYLANPRPRNAAILCALDIFAGKAAEPAPRSNEPPQATAARERPVPPM